MSGKAENRRNALIVLILALLLMATGYWIMKSNSGNEDAGQPGATENSATDGKPAPADRAEKQARPQQLPDQVHSVVAQHSQNR